MKIIRSQNGNTFVTAIFVLVIASVIGLTFISQTMNGTTRNVHREKTNQAMILAEDGITHITTKINEELQQEIEKLDHYTSKQNYLNKYNEMFDSILKKYNCSTGTPITYQDGDKKYEACYISSNKQEDNSSEKTIRTVQFKSIATTDNVTETLISDVKIGAVYTNYPKFLGYAVSTTNGGNLMMNGGIIINGNVLADGNVIVSNSAYLPRLQIERRWIDSLYPEISSDQTIYVNPYRGKLFFIKPETLDSKLGCEKKLFGWLSYYDRINYSDVFNENFDNISEDSCLFKIESVRNTTSHLYNVENPPKLLETVKTEPFDVEKMVINGKKALKNKVVHSDSFYSLYTRGDKDKLFNKNGAAILNGSYYATEPKWFKLGIQTKLLDGKQLVNGEEGQNYFRVTAPLRNNNFIDRSKFTLDGNFHFYGSNLLITGLHSQNTFKGNYYFSNKMPNLNTNPDDESDNEIVDTEGIGRASILIEDGKHTFDGNFYLDKSDITGKAININRGEHTFKGVYFVDGDIEINGLLGSDLQPAYIYADAIFFVNGNVDIDHTLIRSAGGNGKLLIFATGDITYNYATNHENRGNGYFNKDPEFINMFLYSQKGKVELHGTVSNYVINGGVSGQNVFLTGLRGKIDLGMFNRKDFPTVNEQKNSKTSRLTINYDDKIAETFYNKLTNDVNSIKIHYNDFDLYEPIVTSRDFQ